MIYLDNAATSFTKPQKVVDSVTQSIYQGISNPGRSSHSSANNGARLMFEAREAIADFFNAENSENVIFTANITQSLNTILKGLLKKGNHVITSSMEHNSMMRPLRTLEKNGVELSVIQCNRDGSIDANKIEKEIKSNTTLIAINHASNVCGTIQPIKEIGLLAKRKDLYFLVDTAQTAGAIPIDMKENHIDFLAFTGHKSLLGPMGTGGFILGERVDPQSLNPFIEGGTGSNSELEEQPSFMPDMLEAGTPNIPGIAGLLAAIKWLQLEDVKNIREKEIKLTSQLIKGLLTIEDIEIYGTQDANRQTGTVSFNLAGKDQGEVSFQLETEFGIQCRVGLHCSPSAHKTLGTFPDGSIRFSIGCFTTQHEIETAVNAVQKISESK